jgi:hypothetical protein
MKTFSIRLWLVNYGAPVAKDFPRSWKRDKKGPQHHFEEDAAAGGDRRATSAAAARLWPLL